MNIPPSIVNAARIGWKWQWNQLMNGLAPSNSEGSYKRPLSAHQDTLVLSEKELSNRDSLRLPHLIVGASCPWAHRTWLIYEFRELSNSIKLIIAKPDHTTGRWRLEPPWLGCSSLMQLYKSCNSRNTQRATVPVLIDPGRGVNNQPKILGNESARLVISLNQWPTNRNAPNLLPQELNVDVENWQKLIQPAINDGVYRCGFARKQSAYDKACNELFDALEIIEKSLSIKGPWLCGEKLTLADIRLFPTLIRWEMVYMPLFGCSKKPLWAFPKIWEWRQKFFSIPKVKNTCDSNSWRKDYFGALFPLRPSCIVPDGPELIQIINAKVQRSNENNQ